MKKTLIISTILILLALFCPVYATNVSNVDDLPYILNTDGIGYKGDKVFAESDDINVGISYLKNGVATQETINIHFEKNGTAYELFIGKNFLNWSDIKGIPTDKDVCVIWTQAQGYNEHYSNDKSDICFNIPTIPDTGIVDGMKYILGPIGIGAALLMIAFLFNLERKIRVYE